ncbi:discoidin domain-containing protein [Paenibacillus sp. sgz5001063]|uniref:discoidin domain-containing protein n=1 Tax=Paenibacillus sp. sgz5001063 TaxID=3242474 RepID=UPI0036D35101
MTSNAAPSGVANASTQYDSNSPAWKAFDKLNGSTDYWCAKSSTGWLSYEFNAAKVITKYTISPIGLNGYVNRMPKNWTFEGSNNGVDWTVLDTKTDVSSWQDGTIKEFLINNTSSYLKYKINVSSINGGSYLSIGEMEMMESQNVPLPPTLTVSDGNNEILLNWTAVPTATSYTVKRSSNMGGPYMTVVDNVYGTSYTDKNVQSNTMYYYVVSAKNIYGESLDSNEATGTAKNVGRALLTITFSTGMEKEFDLSMSEVNAFIDWYDAKAAGKGPVIFAINKHNNNKGPFISRKDYIVFDKVLTFEVNAYIAE